MKLEKSQKRMLSILSIVLLYAIFDFATNSDQYSKYYFSENSSTTSLSPNKIKKNLQEKRASVEHNLSWKRDPFNQYHKQKPGKVVKMAKSNFSMTLKAITYDSENAFVMINDNILMEGETIQGYLIDKIYKDKVKLSKNGQTEYVYLNSK